MNVDLIHKLGRNNVVLDVLSRREELQAMSTFQVLRLIYKGERDLEWWIREGCMKDPEAYRLLGELKVGKKLKEIKWMDCSSSSKVGCVSLKGNLGYWF
jgi:hypothetical protein